ncbi:PDZ domain-containing protein [Candidatus Poribacteria bacterium]|nr:PDZ domain-containing protein [Candidatus Poribacteria bacterium]
MFKRNSTKWTILFIAVALIIVVGVTINPDKPTFTPQTAIGQTSENFNQDFEFLERANRAFIEVVNRAKPAVVQVTTTRLVSTRQGPSDFFSDDLFEFWFGPRERREQQDRNQPEEKEEVKSGLGSGVIVSEDGYILTNNHVIEDAEGIMVILPNGREYKAKVVGKDAGRQGTDLAVLKIDGDGLPALPLGNSEALQTGEWVIAIGSPFGLAQTVTRGMVSAKGRTASDIGIVEYADFIQTDAAINRGNSGGALINIRGELIGINTAIATGGGFSQSNAGVGFAIPINLAKRIMTQLIEKGEVERGWLGVALQPIDYDLAEKLKLDEPRGALIREAYKGMPAEKAGIRRRDVIVEFDKIRIRDSNHLMHVVAAAGVGKTVEVKVIRDGKEKILRVKLEKRTQEVLARLSGRGGGERFVPDKEDVGAFADIHVQDLTDELAAQYGYDGESGVIVAAVERRSAAARAQITVGTLIQEIEGVEISNLKDYREQIEAVKDKSKILLYIRQPNNRGAAFVTLENLSN